MMIIHFLTWIILFLSPRGLCAENDRDVCLAPFGFASGAGDLVLTAGGLAGAVYGKKEKLNNVSRIS
jgi:hypothetical protein